MDKTEMTTWRENSLLVIDKLETFEEKFVRLEDKMDKLVSLYTTVSAELATAKAYNRVWSSVLGFCCGSIPVLLDFVFRLFHK